LENTKDSEIDTRMPTFFEIMDCSLDTREFEDWFFWTNLFKVASFLNWKDHPIEGNWVDAGPSNSLFIPRHEFNKGEYPPKHILIMFVVNNEETRNRLIEYEMFVRPQKCEDRGNVFYIDSIPLWNVKDGKINPGDMIKFKLGPGNLANNMAIYDYEIVKK
jgi:hypothetical protein